MTLLKLAWRNVLRNRRRSAITLLSIAVGLAGLTFLWGFIDGMNRQMVENTTRYFAGDMQIHVKGYHADPTPDLAIADALPLLTIARADSNVAAASMRLEGKALASRSDKSRGVLLVGVEPADEAKVTVLFDAVRQGRAFDAGAGASNAGVLIGDQLAEALDVRTGDELVLVGQAYDGAIASGRFAVRGVFRTKIDEVDGFVAVMPLAAVREFFGAPAGATAIALRLRDRGDIDAVRASLAARIGERYEVLGWPTLLPLVAVSARFHEAIAFVVLLVFFVVVAAAVANPILMAVLERTREFGILLAVGMSQARLLRLVIYEAVILGVFGLLIGNALGLGITASFAQSGIDLGAFEAGLRTMPGLADVIHPVVRLDRSVMISALVFATACLVALYPGAKAALLDPVAAIRGMSATRGRRGTRAASAARHRWPVFVLIAARNLLRNPRRTAITAGGTAFGIVAFVFLFGFFDGFGEQLIDNSTRYLTGHIQLEQSGFRRDLAPELALGGTGADAAALLAQVRGSSLIAAAAPRIQLQALASSTSKSEGLRLIGVDPEREREVTFIDRTIVEGESLAPGDEREIVVGRKLAEKLGLRLGEKMVVMVQGADGELGTAAYRIRGLFATESTAFDGAIAFVTLPAAQSLASLGTRISTINIRLKDRASLDTAVADLRGRVTQAGLVFAPWQELLPQVDDMVRLNRTISYIVLAVVFVVVAMAIMNTVFMAVTERTREFGVLMALGTAPGAIQRMVVYETLALMLLASVSGYGIGVALVDYFGRTGIDLSWFFKGYSTIPGLTGIIHPLFLPGHNAIPGAVLFVAGILVSLYPAAKAARLDPARAIRHV